MITDGLERESLIKNKMIQMKIILGLALFFVCSCTLYAQNGWNWPEDKLKAEEKNVLYTDAYRTAQYDLALEPLAWLHENAPDLNPSIYINGAKIYEKLAEKETDAAKKAEYQDKALEMYDLRIKHFQEEAKVLNYKASSAYKFYRGNKGKYEEMIELFEKATEMNGNNLFDGNTIAYMDIIRRYQTSGGTLTDEDILKRYDQISGILDHKKTANPTKADKFENMQGQIDAMLSEIVTVDCGFVENNMGPKFKAQPSDLKLAKKIIKLSLTGKCTSSELFLEAAKAVFDQEPEFGLAKVIGVKCRADGDNACANKYLNQALQLTEDNTKRGEVYLELGDMENKKGAKSSARNLYRKAIAADPSLAGKAFTKIGYLYQGSFNDCKAGVSKVADRAVYIAAYEMFERAGNSNMMAKMKEQFPSGEDIFLQGNKEGDTITVGCWINETVTLQKR